MQARMCMHQKTGLSSEGVKPVAEQGSGAPGAEDGGGEQEGAVAAAVVVPGRVLVVHDQTRHVGRRLHGTHCSIPGALLAARVPRLIRCCLAHESQKRTQIAPDKMQSVAM